MIDAAELYASAIVGLAARMIVRTWNASTEPHREGTLRHTGVETQGDIAKVLKLARFFHCPLGDIMMHIITRTNDYERFATERQQKLLQGQSLPHRFVEKPAMKSLLPDLSDKKVLMVGCGTGEESVLLCEFGAKDIAGIDNSPKSIELAKKTYPEHTFEVVDMNKLPYEDASFDFVYSSLAVHYSATPQELYKEMARVLKLGGVFQFSTVHPLRWASERIEIDDVTSKVLGYSEDEAHPRLYGSYMDFRSHSETFPSGEVLEFWVGPPSMHFRLLQQAGFQVENFIETQPIAECKEVEAYYYERNSHFPQFTVFSARKHKEAI